MVNQNKTFSFKIKRQAKDVFPSDVERTVVRSSFTIFHTQKFVMNEGVGMSMLKCSH